MTIWIWILIFQIWKTLIVTGKSVQEKSVNSWLLIVICQSEVCSSRKQSETIKSDHIQLHYVNIVIMAKSTCFTEL